METQERSLNLIANGTLEEAAECLRIMAHPIRLKIVDILMQGEFPVHEIARMCALPAHQASEHLRMLQGRGLLAAHRSGRAVYYRIANPRLPALLKCIGTTCGGSAAASPAITPEIVPQQPQKETV
jgi:DNA-binding transcriptional ArsR family regulator